MKAMKIASLEGNWKSGYRIRVKTSKGFLSFINPFNEFEYKPFIKRKTFHEPPSEKYPTELLEDSMKHSFDSEDDEAGESPYYLYQEGVYQFDSPEYTDEQRLLLILDYEDKLLEQQNEQKEKERNEWERLEGNFLTKTGTNTKGRERIPDKVRVAVWRRDGGQCTKCGSREKLEYDHIVPLSRGGSNTVRNIELLCQSCNRKKSNTIG